MGMKTRRLKAAERPTLKYPSVYILYFGRRLEVFPVLS